MNEEAAELWDQLVASGVSPDEATRQVAAKYGPPPDSRVSAIREGEALGYAPPVRAESSRVPSSRPTLGNQYPPTIGPESPKAPLQPNRVNPVLGSASKAAHGALLGGSDELAGLLSGVTAPFRGESPVDAYKQTAETVRGINRGFSQEHPVAAAIAELGGAVGGGMGAQSLVRLARGAKAVPALANPTFKQSLIRKTIEGTEPASRGGCSCRHPPSPEAAQAPDRGAGQGAFLPQTGLPCQQDARPLRRQDA